MKVKVENFNNALFINYELVNYCNLHNLLYKTYTEVTVLFGIHDCTHGTTLL